MATRILILFLLAGALIGPADLSSCGPFFPEVEFTTKLQPIDESRYFGGELGILQTHYRRVYLIAAYRYLTGVGLDEADRKALMNPPAPPTFWNVEDSTSPVGTWLRARVTVGAPRLDRIERFKSYGDDVYILNCGDDAFGKAVETLAGMQRSEVKGDDLRTWVAAQDQVFENCSGPPPWDRSAKPRPPSIPAPLTPAAAPPMRQDRAYQIAAAKFYAGQFDDSAADFRLIGADRASRWHTVAPYLAARALIRKATLVDAGAAPAAQQQLRAVLADPDAKAWHESTRGLVQYLRGRTEPEKLVNELAHAIETQKAGAAGAINDYRLLLDRYLDRGKPAPQGEDLTDWLVTMQNDSNGHALEKWRATHSLPWLVAALTWSEQPDAEMMAAAEKVDRHSPAYLTVKFHVLRQSPPDEARPQLDAILRDKLPVASQNLFAAERLRLARNWDEVLRDAPRTEEPDPGQKSPPPHLYFDQDSALILDREAALAVLLDAAQSRHLPHDLRLEVAQAAWVRAVMLGDGTRAKAIAPVLAALAPYLKPHLDGYVAAPDDKAREFEAAWLMLKTPGMRPSIDPGIARPAVAQPESLSKLGEFRDNWWCTWTPPEQRLNAPLKLLYRDAKPEASFLTTAHHAEAAKQHERLQEEPLPTTLMARNAVEWVEAHPDDPRAAEALHLAVRAAHYACGGDAETDTWSGRAFRLLHRRYGNTQWAKQTQYWYKVDVRPESPGAN